MNVDARVIFVGPVRSEASRAGRLLLPLSLLVASPVAWANPPSGLPITAKLTPTDEQQLIPSALAASEVGLLAAQSQFQSVKARLAALRGSRHELSRELAMGPGGVNSAADRVAVASLAAEEEAETGADFSRWGSFASVTAERGDADAGTVSPGNRFKLHGFTAGLDYRYSDEWVLGAALGFIGQDINLTQTQGRVDADTWSVTGYSSYANADNWYADGVVTYGGTRYDMRREVDGQTFTAHPDGRSLAFAGTFGRDFVHGGWNFGPYGRVLYTDLSFDSFTERVSGVGTLDPQIVRTHDQTAFSTVLGARFTYAHSTANGVFIPHFDAEWQRDWQGDPATVEASIVGETGIPLVFVGDDLDDNYFRLGVGASYLSTEGRSGFIYYEHVLGRDRYSEGKLAVGVRIEF